MISVFARTIIIYFILIFAIRLMGKRQIGELQIPELIITLMLSELAVSPIANKNLPILQAIVPIFLLLSIEVIISFILTKSNWLKKVMYGSPIILIKDGKADLQAMADNRIEIDELMSELRLKGAPDIQSVKYAILEDNGKLTVFLKAEKSPPTTKDLGLPPADSGIAHEIIIDGEIVEQNLTLLQKDKNWLFKELLRHGVELKDVFLLTLNDADETHLIRKEKKK